MAKPIIITRADKGAALTWEEGDANFINLQNAALPQGGTTGQVLVKTGSQDYAAEFQTVSTDLVSDGSPQLGGVLDINGHSIESIDAAIPILLSSGESYVTIGKSDIAQNIAAKIRITSPTVDIVTSDTVNLYTQGAIGLAANNSISIQSSNVVINNTVWPSTTGTAGQVLASDAGANLFWQTPVVINDASTTSTTEAWSAYKIGQAILDGQAATLGEVSAALDTLPYIASVSEDTAPALGGNLNVGNYSIIGQNNVTATLNSINTIKEATLLLQQTDETDTGAILAVTGANIQLASIDNSVKIYSDLLELNGTVWPISPGTTGQVLATDGGNTLSWVDPDTGPPGAVGFTGSAGADGAQGIIGFTGSRGVAGADGAQGIIGFTGSQGIAGVAGADGAQGPIGFTGSKGDSGTNGIDGAQGPIGFTGSQGIAGADGAQGIQGVAGPIGFTGSQGIQGVAGVAGADGAQGIQGPIGFTGSQGIAGTNGIDGAPGPIGFTGSKGDSGSQGPIGFTGSAAAGGVTINDAATTSTTETWSANKLYTTLGDIQTALTAIIG